MPGTECDGGKDCGREIGKMEKEMGSLGMVIKGFKILISNFVC